ncbi:uncharacterized protein LOC111831528 [Capsella rubella]|uniref:uncharacterized protein LOC111831528 n=1 Tax=Capsella rubella TaxID=81985 RepID=UPI000CD5650B|nr:uncharacterized protein LOC111831528 [Capsella rubella]
MSGGGNTTPPEPRPMTQQLPINSFFPPWSPYPLSILHHLLGSVSLSLSTTLSVKRRTEGKIIETLSRHYQSVSMENDLNDFLNIPLSYGYISSSSSVDGNENTFALTL